MVRFALAMLCAGCGFHATTVAMGADDAAAIGDDAPNMGSDAGSGSNTVTPLNCTDAYAHGMTTSGTVMIDPDGDGGDAPYSVYCDQQTDGGGWTLVWVYGFTDYANFVYGDNAVQPRPTWGIPSGAGTTPTSSTIPTSPTTTGALEFARWASLGDEVMATSDINHWVKCQPNGGSPVTMTEGNVTCQMVKTVPAVCLTSVPAYWGQSDPAGVGFYSSSSLYATYYFYEGYTTTANWPTHDPCGGNSENQLTGVSNPLGQLWIRHR